MTNKLLTLALAGTILAVSACSAHKSTLPPGEYETKKETVNTQGTKKTYQAKTTVTKQDDGSKKAVVEEETTTDPKGLFNKSTSTKKTTETSH